MFPKVSPGALCVRASSPCPAYNRYGDVRGSVRQLAQAEGDICGVRWGAMRLPATGSQGHKSMLGERGGLWVYVVPKCTWGTGKGPSSWPGDSSLILVIYRVSWGASGGMGLSIGPASNILLSKTLSSFHKKQQQQHFAIVQWLVAKSVS